VRHTFPRSTNRLKAWDKGVGKGATDIGAIDHVDTDAADAEKYDRNLFVLAAAPPIMAFIFWGDISQAVAFLVDNFSFMGRNVDGNAFATNLLRPTINGVVVPATAIGLGTLFATTVNVLWNRQLTMRANINKEVCELRLLRRAIFGCFGTAQHSNRRLTALGLLHGYTMTLMNETRSGCVEILEDIQMNGGISQNELDELAEMLHGVDGAAASRQNSVSTAESLLVSLNCHRSDRVAITLSKFPKIHWAILLVLFSSIVASFLIESNQEVLQYLNAVQLRILFAIINAVGSGAAMLLKDLQEPFQGSFCISLSAYQLDSFRKLLEADIAEAETERKEVGPSAVTSLDRDRGRSNYNTKNTVYFHLLTGPLGSNIRVLSEAFAWTFRKVSNTVRSLRVTWARIASKDSNRRGKAS